MNTPSVATVLVALMVAFSGLGKIRRDPRQVRVIQMEGFTTRSGCVEHPRASGAPD